MRSCLAPPKDALERVRWAFLLANLAMCLGAVGVLTSAERSPAWLIAAAAAGVAALALCRVTQYRLGRLPPALDLLDAAALASVALAVGPPKALGLFYLGIHFRSLFGSPYRVVGGLLLYLVLMLSGFVFSPEPVGQWLTTVGPAQVVGFSISAAISHVLVRAFASQRRSIARERVLRRTAARLAGITDVTGRCRVAVRGALALLGDNAPASVAVALGASERLELVATSEDGAGEGRELDLGLLPLSLRRRMLEAGEPVELGSEAGSAGIGLPIGFSSRARGAALIVPLAMNGEVGGVLLASTEARLSASVRGALQTLAAEVGLALESAAAGEDLARRRGEERFRHLVHNASDVIWIIGADSTILYHSPSLERVLGYEPNALVGTRLIDLVEPEEQDRVLASFGQVLLRPGVSDERIEVRWRHRDGSWRWFENTRTNLSHVPSVGGVVLNSRDVTDRRLLEEQLSHQAFHDPLTSLPNRALFKDRLEHTLASRDNAGAPIWILFLDLDEFKEVNDSLGHGAGDSLLVETAARLASCLRPGDTAARLGGDEFAVLLERPVAAEEARDVADRIGSVVSEPLVLDGRRVRTSVTIGIARSGPSRVSADDLLRDADLAMYTAKGRGKARHAMFESGMHAAALRRLELESDLRGAVEAGQIEVHFQPIVAMRTGRAVGLEALARWRHPERGLLPPVEWIPLAEQTELILAVGRRVLEESCRRLAEWRTSPGNDGLRVSVNLSRVQLAQPSLVDVVESVLARFGLAPGHLVLEVTESAAMRDAEAAIARLEALRELGVGLAIDDFGVGYSSLEYLRRFPVHTVKIDKSFVRGVERGTKDAAFARGIIELGRVLGLEVVAEGIERRAQLDELRDLGCDLGQGFLFAHPCPGEEAGRLLGRELPLALSEVSRP